VAAGQVSAGRPVRRDNVIRRAMVAADVYIIAAARLGVTARQAHGQQAASPLQRRSQRYRTGPNFHAHSPPRQKHENDSLNVKKMKNIRGITG
jgi:hypothetical protein